MSIRLYVKCECDDMSMCDRAIALNHSALLLLPPLRNDAPCRNARPDGLGTTRARRKQQRLRCSKCAELLRGRRAAHVLCFVSILLCARVSAIVSYVGALS